MLASSVIYLHYFYCTTSYCAKLLQPCLTLCSPVDCSPPVSSVHGISQARILDWLPFPPPRDVPKPGIKPASLMSPALAGKFFSTSATWEASLDTPCLSKCKRQGKKLGLSSLLQLIAHSYSFGFLRKPILLGWPKFTWVFSQHLMKHQNKLLGQPNTLVIISSSMN